MNNAETNTTATKQENTMTATEAKWEDIPVHSDAWFDKALEKHSDRIPADIRSAAERICRSFDIKGICDPMYIINVIAKETGRGDGLSNF